MRISRANVTGALLLLVAGGCMGGTGSGLFGICCGNGGGNGNNGPAALEFFVQPNTANVGQIMTAVALLKQTPHPTDDDIRTALDIARRLEFAAHGADVIRIDGWVVARSEARVCALIALA